MPGVDDRAVVVIAARADKELRDILDRLLGRGESDALQRMRAKRGQAFQRKREMAAALVRRERVNLIHDDGSRGREHEAAGLGTQKDIERLRCRDDDVRRAPSHAVAFARRRVAGADRGANLDVGKPFRAQNLADA